jgi:hypothetical protein
VLLLTGFNVVHYLLSRGYLTYGQILDEEVTLHPIASRNNCFVVNRDLQHALFLKQPWNQFGGRPSTLEREATCYWLANNDDDFSPLKTFLPAFHSYDQYNHILIVDYIAHSQSLESLFQRAGSVPLAIARSHARLLSRFHGPVYRDIQDKPSLDLFPGLIPSPLRLFGRQLYSLSPESAAGVEVVSRLKREKSLADEIDSLAQQWQAISLIHGDIKSSNCLVPDGLPVTEDIEIRLLDWELADVGDPMWDAAAIVASYLLVWLRLENATVDHAGLPGMAEFSLPEWIADPIKTFWQSYASLAALDQSQERAMISLVGKYAALHLLYRFYNAQTPSAYLVSDFFERSTRFVIGMLKEPLETLAFILS